MKVKSYINHDVSSIEYIYILNDLSVENSYLEDSVRIKSKLAESTQLTLFNKIVTDDKSDKMKGNYSVDFIYEGKWNILVLTDKSRDPLSIIYDTMELNTNEAEKIHLNYLLNYLDASNIIAFISVRDSMGHHIDKSNSGYSHFIPRVLSRDSSQESTLELGSESEMIIPEKSNLIIESDRIRSNDRYYSLKYVINSGIDRSTLDPSKDFLTCSRKSMYLIRIITDSGSRVGRIYNVASQSPYTEFEIPGSMGPLKSINQVDNLSAIIAQDYSDRVFVWMRDWTEGKFYLTQIFKLNNYDILIPTYMDLCSSYIKIPKISTSAPLTYEVCHWRNLLNEDDMVTYSVNQDEEYPSDTDIDGVSDSVMRRKYCESLSRKSSKAYLLSSTDSKFSPVDKNTSDLRNTQTDPQSGLLDLNLKLSVSLFIDIYNNPRNERWNYIIHDCGIELFDSSQRLFIEYDSSATRLVEMDSVIMNKQFLNSCIAKYGFTLDKVEVANE